MNHLLLDNKTETFSIKYLLLVVICMLSMNAFAQASNGGKYLKNAQLIGEARMKYLFWNVYDAKLYAEDGKWEPSRPFALELNYLRKLDGKAIAERSVDEIRDQGFNQEDKLAEWLVIMVEIFPDVDDTSTLIGVSDENQHTIFYFNDEEIGKVDDPEFTLQFFNIWLGEKTSEPGLRKKLLGIS